MAVGALGARSCEKEALAQLLEVRKKVPSYRQQDGVLAEEMALQVGGWPVAGVYRTNFCWLEHAGSRASRNDRAHGRSYGRKPAP
jgi:hypothetical protein